MPTVPAKMKKQPARRTVSARKSIIGLSRRSACIRLGRSLRHAEKRQRNDGGQKHQHQGDRPDRRNGQPFGHQQQYRHAGGGKQQRGQQPIAVGRALPRPPEPGAQIEQQEDDGPGQHGGGHGPPPFRGGATEKSRAIRCSRRVTDSSPPSASVCTTSTCSPGTSSALNVPGNRLMVLISSVLGWPSGTEISCSKKRGDTGMRGCRDRHATSMPPRNDSKTKKPANSTSRIGFHQNGRPSASQAARPPPISAAINPTGQPSRPSKTSHSEKSTTKPCVAQVTRERMLVPPCAVAAPMGRCYKAGTVCRLILINSKAPPGIIPEAPTPAVSRARTSI